MWPKLHKVHRISFNSARVLVGEMLRTVALHQLPTAKVTALPVVILCQLINRQGTPRLKAKCSRIASC